MKRNNQDYQKFSIYEEVFHIKFLSPLEKLTFATMYNLLSKGKGHLERGLMPNSFNTVINQHRGVFGIEEKIKKSEWQKAIDSLVSLDMLRSTGDYTERTEKFGRLITTTRKNYVLGNNGELQVKRAKNTIQTNSFNFKQLF